MSDKATVFVVDDDQAVRNALRFTLRAAGYPVETFPTALAFLQAYDSRRPGCLILDVRMPGMSGLDLQESLAAHNVSLPVIFLTGHGDVPMAVRALKHGAFEFLEKPFDNEALLARVRHALESHALERRREERYRQLEDHLGELSQRERRVLDGLVAGKSNKAIAKDLRVSVSTVEIARRRVMEKMQADSLSTLVTMMLFYREHRQEN